MTTRDATFDRLTLIRGGLDIDAELLESARRWARFNRLGVEIRAVRFMLGEGERWIVVHWADGRHLCWPLDGYDDWRDPPPWDEGRGLSQPASHDPGDNEARYFIVCPTCRQAFDSRELDQVLHHQRPGHKPFPRS